MTAVVPFTAAPPTEQDVRTVARRSSRWSKWTSYLSLRKGFRIVAPVVFGSITPHSVAVFHDYEQYRTSVSSWRIAAVLFLTPVSTLVTAVIPAMVTLQDPRLCLLQNPGYFVHLYITGFFTLLGGIIQVRGVTRIPHHTFTHLDVLMIAIISGVVFAAYYVVTGCLWRFPVPFSWALAFVPWFSSLAFAYAVVFRQRLLRDKDLARRLLAYLPSLIFKYLKS